MSEAALASAQAYMGIIGAAASVGSTAYNVVQTATADKPQVGQTTPTTPRDTGMLSPRNRRGLLATILTGRPSGGMFGGGGLKQTMGG